MVFLRRFFFGDGNQAVYLPGGVDWGVFFKWGNFGKNWTILGQSFLRSLDSEKSFQKARENSQLSYYNYRFPQKRKIQICSVKSHYVPWTFEHFCTLIWILLTYLIFWRKLLDKPTNKTYTFQSKFAWLCVLAWSNPWK